MSNKENKKKKAYQPPKVSTKEIYEVNALACAKCPSPSSKPWQPSCFMGIRKYS